MNIKPEQIRWRVGSLTKDQKKGMLLGYIDSRTAMELLDGEDAAWSDNYAIVKVGGDEGVECALTVNGVTRTDVGVPSNTEGLKGAYSDALKRAAVKHGIGRELYELPRIWVTLDEWKRPTSEPAYRNGRWTLPSGSGSVVYDHEPIQASEQGRGPARAASSPRASAPAHYRRGELAELMKLHEIDLAAVEQIATVIGIPKAERPMSDESMDRLIEAIATPQSEGSPSSEGSAAATVPEVRPPSPPAPAPLTMEDVLAVTGGEEVHDGSNITLMMSPPSKPGTAEYKGYTPQQKAESRAYWQKHEVSA